MANIKISQKSTEQLTMIFAKNTKYVAQVLSESIIGQKGDNKDISSYVLSVITDKSQAILNKLTEAKRAELLAT